MISGNMRVLATIAGTSASSFDFNSNNMVGCTIFCLQYAFAATAGMSPAVTINGSSSNFSQTRHNYDEATSATAGGSTSALLWQCSDDTNSPYLTAEGTMASTNAIQGELWVRSNLRSSSYPLLYWRNVRKTSNDDLATTTTYAYNSGITGAQITSIALAASSGNLAAARMTLWGGLD
jgi:hypothetical protein